MKALVLSVLFGLVLTVSLVNPINQQDAAPDSSRDAADALESYNPERKSEDDFPSNSDEESDEDSFDNETRVSDETPGENEIAEDEDEDEDDAEYDEHLAVTGPLKKVSDPFPIRFRRLVRAGRRIIRGRRVAIRNAIRRFLRRRRFRG